MPQHPLNIPVGANLSPAITSATGTQEKTGAGVVMGVSVLVAGAGAGTITLYDGTSASGNELAVVSVQTAGFTPMQLSFKTGLFAVTSEAATVKVAYF
jgi:hypothetical protein